jgi:hypothetical protein
LPLLPLEQNDKDAAMKVLERPGGNSIEEVTTIRPVWRKNDVNSSKITSCFRQIQII